MSIGVLHGQAGGIKLPFRVIGGTTQPSNPKDGDIWVKTSVPIMRTEFANGTWASGGVGLVFLAGTLGGSNPTGANSTVWAINKNTGASKYVLKITLTGCKQVQGSTGNWVSLDAYRYYGGTWVQFSSEFTATINITYPAGSTCTVTDGKTTITAPNTSGTWACVVPNAGTWTVSITNKAGTKSKSVTITSDGQTERCVLGAPSDYQEVVYLESTGAQFIKTGLTNCKSYRHRVVLKAQPTIGTGGILYGEASVPYLTLLIGSGGGLSYTSKASGGSPGGSPSMNPGDTFILERLCGDDGILIVKNNGVEAVTYDCSSNGFNNNRSREPYIFSWNNAGNADEKMKAKLYWLNIYDIDNTTLLREFVPCYRKSDSVAGLYDLVNGVFYTNAGSRTFVVGGNV